MRSLQIVVEPYASNHLKQVVEDGLGLYNTAVTGFAEYYPVAIFLKDDNGEILGGVLGHIWGSGCASRSSGWLSPSVGKAMGASCCWRPRPMHASEGVGMCSCQHSASRPVRSMKSWAMKSSPRLRTARWVTANTSCASSSQNSTNDRSICMAFPPL
jgi:hypothetical protein